MINGEEEKYKFLYTTTSDKKKIRFCFWPKNKKGIIIFLNGRNEYIEKYHETYLKFQKRDYAVVSLDWRGQGRSEKEENVINFGHVDNFLNYQKDLESVLNKIEIKKIKGKKILVCHSTGCLIGLRFLNNNKFKIDQAIFLAPLWGGNFYQKIISIICIFFNNIGIKKKSLNFNKKPYILNTNLKRNCLTSNPVTFKKLQEQIKKSPEFNIGPPTISWIAGAASEIKKLTFNINLMNPYLIFFGEKDIIISKKDIERKIKNKNNIYVIKKAKHELLIEKDEIVKYLWTKIDEFI